MEEAVRNRIAYMSLMTILQEKFKFGRKQFPEGYKKPYTLVGRSLNDLCIHSYSKRTEVLKLGLVFTGIDHNTHDEEVDSEMEDLHDHSLAAGVIECKRKHHEIYQTIAEMIRCAGDLVAESLIRGQLVRKTDIFGLGLNYDTQTAKLIDLSIDFDKDSGTTLVSDKVLPLHPAMCWLLDCIVV